MKKNIVIIVMSVGIGRDGWRCAHDRTASDHRGGRGGGVAMKSHWQSVEKTFNEKEIDKLFGFDVTDLSWSHDKQGRMILHVGGIKFERVPV